MISLTCKSCKKSLEIDDAFAGGVCRCQHCGTIQTVPARRKGNSRPAGPTAPTTPSKALYQRKSPENTEIQPSDASAPPATSSVPPAQRRAAHPVTPPEESKKNNNWITGVAIGAAAALVIGIVAWLAS